MLVRHTITVPEHGPLRNGTGATVTGVDPQTGEVRLRLADGRELTLDREQVQDADLRLSYVQHPFPVQRHTSDTAHVIIAGHATSQQRHLRRDQPRTPRHPRLRRAPA